MTQTASQVPVKSEQKAPEREAAGPAWRPLEGLRREIDRVFEDFGRAGWNAPFRRAPFSAEPLWQSAFAWGDTAPAVDIVDKGKAYEITAELPGMDEKAIEVKLTNGGLTIKGEKQEEKEEKKKDYYLHERSFGSFERSFTLPDGVDAEKIEASFKKGVLTVTLPKKPEASLKPEKKIEVKSAA